MHLIHNYAQLPPHTCMSLSLSFVVDDKDNDGPLGHSVVAT